MRVDKITSLVKSIRVVNIPLTHSDFYVVKIKKALLVICELVID